MTMIYNIALASCAAASEQGCSICAKGQQIHKGFPGTCGVLGEAAFYGAIPTTLGQCGFLLVQCGCGGPPVALAVPTPPCPDVQGCSVCGRCATMPDTIWPFPSQQIVSSCGGLEDAGLDCQLIVPCSTAVQVAVWEDDSRAMAPTAPRVPIPPTCHPRVPTTSPSITDPSRTGAPSASSNTSNTYCSSSQ